MNIANKCKMKDHLNVLMDKSLDNEASISGKVRSVLSMFQ